MVPPAPAFLRLRQEVKIHTFIIRSGVQGNSVFLLQTSKTHRIRCLLLWCLTLCLPTLRPQSHSYCQPPSSLSFGYLLPSWLTKRGPFSVLLSFPARIDHYTLTYSPQGGRHEPERATWLLGKGRDLQLGFRANLAQPGCQQTMCPS